MKTLSLFHAEPGFLFVLALTLTLASCFWQRGYAEKNRSELYLFAFVTLVLISACLYQRQFLHQKNYLFDPGRQRQQRLVARSFLHDGCKVVSLGRERNSRKAMRAFRGLYLEPDIYDFSKGPAILQLDPADPERKRLWLDLRHLREEFLNPDRQSCFVVVSRDRAMVSFRKVAELPS